MDGVGAASQFEIGISRNLRAEAVSFRGKIWLIRTFRQWRARLIDSGLYLAFNLLSRCR